MTWERFDYANGETIWQRECPDCSQGLLLAPVRFCPRCNGSGYLVAVPISEPDGDTVPHV